MFIRPNLRNKEDTSPGGGAAPPVPADPAAPSGTPAPATAAPAFTPEALKSAITDVLTAALPDLRNGIFADLRKAGAFKQEPKPTETPTPTPGTAQPQAGMVSMADVEAMMERERVVTSRATKHELSDAQVRRMKSALIGVAPEQLAFEADSFLSDLGLGKANAAAQPAHTNAQPATPAAPAATPAVPAKNLSDGGPATAGDVRDVDSLVETKPLSLTSQDIARHDAKHGHVKAREIRNRAINAALTGVKAVRG